MKQFCSTLLLILLVNFCHATNLLDTIPYPNPSNWLNSFDLDGDKINEEIYFDYSGGAHCCYHIHIKLSSNETVYDYPFDMDGGYIFGVDNSWPDKFDIQDYDKDGLPEIKMMIQTYNAEIGKVPFKWKTKYHIKSNTILIEYENGKLITRDFK
jgi:hypothetical protein